MELQSNLKELKKQIQNKNLGRVSEQEYLKKYTTLKIGGKADLMVFPETEDQIKELINLCIDMHIEYTIVGHGSNILVSDKGIRGLVITLKDNFSDIKIEGERIYASAGASLRTVSKFSFENELMGMEAVSGIPGTVGGAVIMNAGAYGTEMKDIIEKVRCLDTKGNVVEYNNSQMNFSYRDSLAAQKNLVVLSASFKLKKGDKKTIYENFRDFDEKRWSKQPMDAFSAGSTFKRPEGYYASKIIDESGLRGFKVGNAQVSEKHCGFLINNGESTCENFLTLIQEVKKIVKEKHGVELEREVKLIGDL